MEICLADDLTHPRSDLEVTKQVQEFASRYTPQSQFLSFVAIYQNAPPLEEVDFERHLWERLQAMHEVAKSYTAEYKAEQNTADVTAAQTLLRMMEQGLNFPVVAKPDLGWCGYGVRLIQNSAQLEEIFDSFPKNETVVLQRCLPETSEADIFYYSLLV